MINVNWQPFDKENPPPNGLYHLYFSEMFPSIHRYYKASDIPRYCIAHAKSGDFLSFMHYGADELRPVDEDHITHYAEYEAPELPEGIR